MSSANLENLDKAGKLKAEAPDRREFDGLVRSGLERLANAKDPKLFYSSRFDLGYNAAHALSLAALRRLGYRSDNRYLVFQCLAHTLGLAAEQWRVLALAHERRSTAEHSCLDSATESSSRFPHNEAHVEPAALTPIFAAEGNPRSRGSLLPSSGSRGAVACCRQR
jgi:hypothetical protein